MKRILFILGSGGCIQPITDTNPFIESGERLPTWELANVLASDGDLPVSPDDYEGNVSAYYFGHAT